MKSSILRVLLLAMVFCIVSQAQAVEQLDFYQVNFILDEINYPDTEWGAVKFTFTGQEPIMYFNLSVNGTWQIENIPVQSAAGVGVDQSMFYYFDLGTIRGDNVGALDYDYAFTEYVLYSAPNNYMTVPVSDKYVVMNAGSNEDGSYAPMPEPDSAAPLKGGKAVSPVKHSHDPNDFPNQQCGKNECAPAAVSNSLQFLNKKHKLGLDPNAITINQMKNATGWGVNGVPAHTWWDIKNKYMKENGFPISTRWINDVSKLIKEIDDGQDVEMQLGYYNWNASTRKWEWIGGHTIAVTGIKEVRDAADPNKVKYAIDIVDDVNQADPCDGCDGRTATYNPKNGTITAPGYRWASFRYAVVECPDPNWAGDAAVSQHWRFGGTGSPVPAQDSNSPYNTGISTMVVNNGNLVTKYDNEYVLTVENDANSSKFKKVWLQFKYTLPLGSSIMYPSGRGMHETPGGEAWKITRHEEEKLPSGDYIVTNEWTITPQPAQETFKWWVTGQARLTDVKVRTICIDKPTPCKKAKKSGSVLLADLNDDCTVDFFDFEFFAGDWLNSISLWP